jgi:hypothetical protein
MILPQRTEIVEKYKKRRKIHYRSKKRSCAKGIFESIKGCKHPIIASGATTIRSTSRAPNEMNTRIMKLEK